MVITVIFILIIVILIAIIFLSLGTGGKINHEPDHHNFITLQKLFFAVSPAKLAPGSTANFKKVYGVMIETEHPEMGKVIFTSFITGFAGYYKLKGGGIIAGKKYLAGSRTVQVDVMDMCRQNRLVGLFQNSITKKLSQKLVINAHQYLFDTVPYNGTYGILPDSTGFWFLTESGFQCKEILNSKLPNSHFYALVKDSFKIIEELDSKVLFEEEDMTLDRTESY